MPRSCTSDILIIKCPVLSCLVLANIYAPNEDNPNFFQSFYDQVLSFQCEDIIIGGDFNLVLDIEKDKKGGLPKTHKNALKILQEFSENLHLNDVSRTLNPETRRYTWRQKQPEIHCRLDFFSSEPSSYLQYYRRRHFSRI